MFGNILDLLKKGGGFGPAPQPRPDPGKHRTKVWGASAADDIRIGPRQDAPVPAPRPSAFTQSPAAAAQSKFNVAQQQATTAASAAYSQTASQAYKDTMNFAKQQAKNEGVAFDEQA
ncbi:MAG: hypothetical protein ACYTAF_16990 [Planctomycetota bacterium]|jgi:hypothetical protein